VIAAGGAKVRVIWFFGCDEISNTTYGGIFAFGFILLSSRSHVLRMGREWRYFSKSRRSEGLKEEWEKLVLELISQ